jgi:hypothetical protein
MTKRRVLVVICDTCGREEYAPVEFKSLPPDWIHVTATDSKHKEFLDRDLCPEHASYLVTLSKQFTYEERLDELESQLQTNPQAKVTTKPKEVFRPVEPKKRSGM